VDWSSIPVNRKFNLAMRKFLLFASFFYVFIFRISFETNAQTIATPNDTRSWQEMMQDPNTSFFVTKDRFKQYWQNRPVTKGSGFKAFKRWEWFMTPRISATGEWPQPDALWQAMQDQPEMFETNNTMPSDWSYIGNTSVPTGGGGAGRINSVRELPGSTTTFFACSPGGGVWKTTNSGVSWSVLGTDFISSIGVSDIAIDPTNNNVMYIATGDCDAGDTYALGVLKSTDGGITWNTTGLTWTVSQARSTSRILIHPTNTQIIICATSNGIYRSLNGGTSWTQEASGSFKDLCMKPGDPNTWYASSDEFVKSTNAGDTWTTITSGLPASGDSQRMSIAVSAANSSVVYALVSGNDSGLQGVYKSTDSGTTFAQRADSDPNYLNWDTSATSELGGQGWYDLRIEADPTNSDIVYIGGVNVWKSTNSGTSFALAGHWYGGGGAPYVHADIHALHFVAGTNRLLVGCDGGVFTTTNGGPNFSDISSNLAIGQLYKLSVAGTNSNIVISGWQDNGTNLKNGSTHSRPLGGDGMDCQINPTNASVMYGAIYYGSISKSTNGGASWSNIVGSGGTNEDEDGAWVTPYVLGPNPNHLFVGKSVVFKSTDAGVNFTASAAFGGPDDCNDLAIAPSNANILYASKGSNLFKSTNNAASFTAVSGMPGHYITDIAIHPTDPNQVWVSFSNYTAGVKVYFSANGGITWVNVSGSLPNLPANALACQPGANNGIYVGMDAGVYYKDDVLGNFVPYLNSLPNVEITELDINPGTSTITAATYGRGLWRAPLYALPNLDAAIIGINSPTGTYCSTTVTPQIEVLNVGTTPIISMSISYQVTGQSLQNYNWNGNITTGGSAIITLPNLNYGEGAFSFSASITAVNTLVDDNSINNSSTSEYYCIEGINTATLLLETDCWSNETSWNITDENANVIYSGAGYPGESVNEIQLCLPNGCFTFNIFDSYGDGLSNTSCSQGNGSYGITDDPSGNNIVVMANANFGTGISHDFCYPLNAVPGCMNAASCNYNPLATIDDGSCTTSPVNDLCSGAFTLSINAPAISASNVVCLQGPNPSCGGSQISDVWFKFVYTGGPVTISTDFSGGTLTDTRLALYTSCGGLLIACNDDISGSNFRSLISAACSTLTLGQTYYVQAGGYNGSTGSFSIQITAPIETCNGVDDNCNGSIDEGFDLDGDGYTTCAGDCNDNNAAISPGDTELCNGIDDDCDLSIDEGVTSTFYRDLDNDGYGNAAVTIQACSVPVGYVTNNTDCNDNNAAISPADTEVCNTIDDDCDGSIDEGVTSTFYRDLDNDGYGNAAVTIQACSVPVGYVTNNSDCNDNNAAISPADAEVCNTIDDDCDGSIDEGVTSTFYRDLDNDGYGNAAVTIQACSAPVGYVTNNTDCNDNNAAISPADAEVCNTIDDDCDGSIDEGVTSTFYRDLDNDGYGNAAVTIQACSAPIGYVTNNTDCNDNNAAVSPADAEICNTIDDNCNGSIDEGCCSISATSSVTNATCGNPTSGAVDLSIVGGVSPITYAWSNGAQSQDLNGVAAGEYSVTIEDANDCIIIVNVTIGTDGGSTLIAPIIMSGPTGVCRSTSGHVFSVQPVDGATSYIWTLPTGATGTSTSNSITLSFSSTYNTGNICVVASNDCMQSTQFCRSIQAFITNPSTPANINGQALNVCAGSNLTYSIEAVSNATSYIWSAPPNATITSGQGTTTVSVAFNSGYNITGTLAVRSVNCFGQSSNRNLSIYSIPGLPGAITGDAQSVCAGSSRTYSIAAVAGANSYFWSVPAGASINSGIGTTSINVTFPANFTSGVISVRAQSNCGLGNARSMNVYSVPAISGTLTGQSSNLCAGGDFTYSVNAPVGALSYNWTLPPTATMVTNNGNSAVVNIPPGMLPGSICVSATNTCGTSAPKCLALTSKPAVPAVIVGQATVCNGAQGVAYATANTPGLTYIWTLPGNASIASGSGSNAITTNWLTTGGVMTVRSINGCGSSGNRSKSITVVSCIEGELEDENVRSEIQKNEDLTLFIYPNPNDGNFSVRSSFKGDFVLYNEVGQIVNTFQLTGENYLTFEIKGLSPGFYFLRGNNGVDEITQKIIVSSN
jgi:hypothetical protein